MRTILILGASSDVSIAYLSRLEMREESCLALCQYNAHDLALREMEERFSHVEIIPLKCDLRNVDNVAEFAESIACKYQIDEVLHLAAPALEYRRIREYTWDYLSELIRVQVGAIMQVSASIFPEMAKKGGGRVVVMLSSATLGAPPSFMADYVVSKYALLGFVKSAAVEYGGKGIRINGISPAMMDTKFLANIDSRIVESAGKSSFLGRNVLIEEACAAIDYLLSAEAFCVNGINLNLSGGERM